MGSDVGVGGGRCVQVLWRETGEEEEGKERKRKEEKKGLGCAGVCVMEVSEGGAQCRWVQRLGEEEEEEEEEEIGKNGQEERR